jgi:iojap-like ribosome-associated protein
MSKKIIDRIVELIFSKKGYNVKILDLRTLTTITDYFIICTGDSDTQVKAIADEVDKQMRDEGVRSWHTEGYRSLNWVLIDFVDIVVHVFKKESREYYNLEKLWGDAPFIIAEDPLLKIPVKRKPGRPKKIKSE